MNFPYSPLARPQRGAHGIEKGVVIVNRCDELCEAVPHLKDYFYLVERRGWFGMNKERNADIKLVDDPTTMEETRKKFPHAIPLVLADGDFVDTDLFHPLNIPKIYTGIQIAAWPAFKRHELFVRAAALLPQERFIKFGHFWQKSRWFDRNSEAVRRRKIIRLAHRLHASIDFPGEADASEVNRLVNTAKMGILTSEHEGLSRFKMECLSADIPVLVPEDAGPATTRHINEKTGMLFKPTPEDLAEAIRYVEDHLGSFSPRAYVLEKTGMKNSLVMLRGALQILAKKDGSDRSYEEIKWDGRNERFVWTKEEALEDIKKAMNSFS
ncbi:glycosyltransferase [Patescibacteria group bacterium]|nr:glycosyltransferase [Patescibacteria group bacterium]